GRRRNPSDVLRDERAEATDLQDHRPAFDGIGPEGSRLNTWRGRLQARESDADGRDHHQTDPDDDALTNPLLADVRGAGYIHGTSSLPDYPIRLLSCTQHQRDGLGQPFPVCALIFQLATPGAREPVEFGVAAGLGGLPLGLQPAAGFEAMQRR